MKAYGQTARTVFVVDDDRVVRNTLCRLVGSLGLAREVRRRSRHAARGDRPAAGTRRVSLCVPVTSMRALRGADGRSWLPRGPWSSAGSSAGWQFRV